MKKEFKEFIEEAERKDKEWIISVIGEDRAQEIAEDVTEKVFEGLLNENEEEKLKRGETALDVVKRTFQEVLLVEDPAPEQILRLMSMLAIVSKTAEARFAAKLVNYFKTPAEEEDST